MVTQIIPKLKQILKNEKSDELQGFKTNLNMDPLKEIGVKKKALLAAFRAVQKCPQYSGDFVDIFQSIFRETNHGIIISAIPLYREVFKHQISNEKNIKKLMPELLCFVDKVKKLLTHLDPEYTVGGINDPFLVISLLRLLTDCLTLCEQNFI